MEQEKNDVTKENYEDNEGGKFIGDLTFEDIGIKNEIEFKILEFMLGNYKNEPKVTPSINTREDLKKSNKRCLTDIAGVTLDEISEGLNITKTTASVRIRNLRHLQLVQEGVKSGKKKTFYFTTAGYFYIEMIERKNKNSLEDYAKEVLGGN